VVQKVLIIRLSSIGDVIHCTPVARSLKISWPDCKITWLVGEVSAELLRDNPYIDEIIVWSREKFEKYLRSFEFQKALAMWTSLKEQLSAKSFDVVLDIHGLFLTGMIAKLARTDRRIGMSQAKELNSFFMTETAAPCGLHITDKYLGVLRPLGISSIDHQMFLAISEEERVFAQNFLAVERIGPHEKFLIVIPGTTWLSKNWPTDLFAQTIQILCKEFKIVMCGGKAEVELGRKIQEQAGVPMINAVGKTGLLEMAALIEKGAVVIAGDTGPLHIAAALMVPTVSIFGPTNPITYAPLGQGNAIVVNNLPCSFCHKVICPQGNAICMSSITPQAVADQVHSVAART